MKVIGIIGSRRRNEPADFEAVRKVVMEIYHKGDRFVSGGCRQGGDKFCEYLARDLGAPIMIYHADWNGLGKSAGFARNTSIAQDAGILVACVSPDRTGGTEDTIKKFQALKPNNPLIIV